MTSMTSGRTSTCTAVPPWATDRGWGAGNNEATSQTFYGFRRSRPFLDKNMWGKAFEGELGGTTTNETGRSNIVGFPTRPHTCSDVSRAGGRARMTAQWEVTAHVHRRTDLSNIIATPRDVWLHGKGVTLAKTPWNTAGTNAERAASR